jgi:hypothetical protein
MGNETISRYEVDAAMMGQNWNGDARELRRFCGILQDILDSRGVNIRVDCVADTHNGARNDEMGDVDLCDDQGRDCWDDAIDQHAADALERGVVVWHV